MRRSLLCLVSLLAYGSAMSQVDQPTQCQAFHRSGQTFITWVENPNADHYRIYRHHLPINAGNLAQATYLYTVPQGSAVYHTERMRAPDYPPEQNGGYSSLRNHVIRDLGPELTDGTGLLVWTGHDAGDFYYAITSVDQSLENRAAFSSANTLGPITETPDTPQPVLVWRADNGRGMVFTHFMDLSNWNPTYETPDGLTYAYNYFVGLPDDQVCEGTPPGGPYALLLHIEGYGTRYHVLDRAHYYCAAELWCDDPHQSWYYGYSATHDYSDPEAQVTQGPVVNFTEQRLLMAVDHVVSEASFHVDPQRIYCYGQSMGGSGALALGMRYPNVFAAVFASQPMTQYRSAAVGCDGDWVNDDLAPKWGSPQLNLPIENRGNHATHLKTHDGLGVWDWMDHQNQLQARRGDDMAFLALTHGMNDRVIAWDSQGQPAYGVLDQSTHAFSGEVTDADHTWIGFIGMAPPIAEGGNQIWGPFYGFDVVRDETLPGLSNASGNPTSPPRSTGGYNLTMEWSSSWYDFDGPPVDQTNTWAISLRTTDGTHQSVDVTPRRLQHFVVQPNTQYEWENTRIADGSFVESGAVTPDANGLITLTNVHIDPEGNRIRITPGDGIVTPTYEYNAYIPHVASSSVWDTYLVLDNAGDATHAGQVVLYQDGAVHHTQDFSLLPGASETIALDQGTCGYVGYDHEEITLRAAFINNQEYGIVEFQLHGQAHTTQHFIQPQYIAEHLSWMGLAIMNPSAWEADATLSAFATDGSVLGTADVTIPSQDRSVGFVWDFFPDLDFADVARIACQSDTALCGINISGQGNQRLLFTQAHGPSAPQGTLHLAHIAVDFANWNNFLILDNLGANTASAKLILYSNGTQVVQEEVSVTPQASHVIQLNAYQHLSPQVGTLTTDSTQLAVRQSYQNATHGGTAEFFITDACSHQLIHQFPGYVSEELDWMGLAVANTESTPAEVSLTAWNHGQSVGTASLSIGAHQRTSALLSNLFSIPCCDGVDRVTLVSDTRMTGINISGSGHSRLLFMPAVMGPDEAPPPPPPNGDLDTSPPDSTVKLIFIHHSTGENWLADWSGKLGINLRDNNYFVSDTNYGWGPNGIGDRTDTGHWYEWFLGPNRDTYLSALFDESQQHAEYRRRPQDPGGENQVIMFKSCFPNSHISGNPSDPPRPEGEINPLWSQDAYSGYQTVENVKGVYRDLLGYFATRQDKLFILVVPPPLVPDETDSSHAANARAVANWLVHDWLQNYPHDNVFAFDFFNVLTSNGGNPNTHDANTTSGNHHRVLDDAIQHQVAFPSNFSAYGTDDYDSHPTPAGNQKATIEFLPLLNAAYHHWIDP